MSDSPSEYGKKGMRELMEDSLNEQMLGKAKIIYHSFDYTNFIDFETLEMIHVPSTFIQSTAVLKKVIRWMIVNTQIEEISPQRYKRLG
jgi:glycerophosphoryl diester phosphodiesterase